MGFVGRGLVANRLRLIRDVHAGSGRPPIEIEL